MASIKRRFWTPDEDERMLDMLGDGVPPRAVAKELNRTIHGLRSRLEQLHISRVAIWRDGLVKVHTLADVARLFGVLPPAVRRWVDYGWLAARRDHRRRLVKRWFFIHDLSVQVFVDNRQTWMAWDPAAITDPDWRGYAEDVRREAGGRWVGTAEIARRHHVAVFTVGAWLREGRLPYVRHGNVCYVWSADLDGFAPPAETVDFSARSCKAYAVRRANQARREVA